MHIFKSNLIIAMFVGILLAIPAVSLGMDIVPNYDPNITQAQRDILDYKISLWEGRLCCDIVLNIDFSNADLGDPRFGPLPKAEPGVELVIGIFPTGEWGTLGETDQFQEDAQGRPTHARIRFNNNPSVDWYYGTIPDVPDEEYDFWTVANHEIVHAAGFSVNYARFNACVAPGPGGNRTFRCGGIMAILTPAGQGTHLDPATYPGNLMNPELNMGERRTPNQLIIEMLLCVWPRAGAPTLTQWGLIILVALIVFSTWVVLKRRKAVVSRQ